MDFILESLKNGVIVSCQAEGNDPFNSPEGVSLFAKAAEMGGAKGIRSEGLAKTQKILETVTLPVIGLVKDHFDDGTVCITRSIDAVDRLVEMGCSMIAIDGTLRIKNGQSGPDFIHDVKDKFKCLVMADIDWEECAQPCVSAGADCLSTTLSGYTPETQHLPKDKPDTELVSLLVVRYNLPIFAEGKINTPALASEIMRCGAWAIVVGTAITRPRVVTSWFVDAITKKI